MRRKIALALPVLACAASGVSHGAPMSFGACRLSQFTVRLGPEVSEATGQHTLTLRLVNRGHRPCALEGYPRIRAYDRSGLIPFAFKHGGDQMITSRPPRRIVVRPARVAYVAVNHYRCDRGDLRSSTMLRIGEAEISLRDPYQRLAYCGRGDPGSMVAVSPFEPTLRATLAH
jgi:uncharacterized protein DUF4232